MTESKTRKLCLFLLLPFLLATAQETTTYIAHYLEPFPGPQVYKDSGTGTLLYVESDGRHVSAISAKGKLLWNREPFKDARLPFYRTHTPQIVYIGPTPEAPPAGKPNTVVRIVFNSSQFGDLRLSDGKFTYAGQD